MNQTLEEAQAELLRLERMVAAQREVIGKLLVARQLARVKALRETGVLPPVAYYSGPLLPEAPAVGELRHST